MHAYHMCADTPHTEILFCSECMPKTETRETKLKCRRWTPRAVLGPRTTTPGVAVLSYGSGTSIQRSFRDPHEVRFVAPMTYRRQSAEEHPYRKAHSILFRPRAVQIQISRHTKVESQW